MRSRPDRFLPRLSAVALLTVLGLLISACGDRRPVEVSGGKLEASASPVAGEQGTVDLRVYLRAGSGPLAYLEPVSRRTTIAVDLPRRALELLFAGPTAQDREGLHAPLPTRTTLRSFAVRGDLAVVDLSPEAVTDAADVEPTREHELLALAAVANTLTEFPAINRVRLTVDGHRMLWGGWDLPESLTRDEQVIGPRPESDPLPTPERFVAERQQVGSEDGGPVAILGARTFDRVGFVRFVVELGDPAGQVSAQGIPRTVARIQGDRLVLQIDDVLSSVGELAPGARVTLQDLPFDTVEAEAAQLPGSARFALSSGSRAFWLHTLTSPTRVVLDVRK